MDGKTFSPAIGSSLISLLSWERVTDTAVAVFRLFTTGRKGVRSFVPSGNSWQKGGKTKSLFSFGHL